MDARVQREGDALVFTGPLDREAVPGLWRAIGGAPEVIRVARLQQVESVDSAGIALLAELASRHPEGLVVEGSPPGLSELRAAYRLGDRLRFG
ncbi:STAS domain-containing protein [Lysobacter sp. GX 14042]|uniref:STAS domain-containing protein n=1 Tax=Lysobacter sp. GX 14042 TaxID=2907155 RepID=UPI001F1A111A|nr:STAS domain-containing protein [Lysobacter sp. GX 14042]MCE7032316.1 STAS domain-containing protein [Lysobacter sp. GX 14042]